MTDAKLVLHQISLVARDYEATLTFYRRLGVAIPVSPVRDGIGHAKAELPDGIDLEFDTQKLAGIYNAAWRQGSGSSRVLIGFSLPSREAVDARYADLVAAGYEGRQPPYDTFWGARYAVVADPDGNDVGLMSPVDPERRFWPPKDSPAP